MIATARIAVSGGDDRPQHAAETARLSPTLALCLDFWGQTVAHRAACHLEVKWRDKGLQRHQKTVSAHLGFELNAFALQRDWKRAVGAETSLPQLVVPSPWTQRIIAAAAEDELDPSIRQALGSMVRPVGPKMVQASYLTVCHLIEQDYLWRTRWDRRGPCLLTWLFAVPHLYGQETTVGNWMGGGVNRVGPKGRERNVVPVWSEKEIREAESVLKGWARVAKQQVTKVVWDLRGQ